MECIDIEERAGSAIIHFNNGEMSDADIVIIANGAASKLRQKLFPESNIDETGLISARGLVSADRLDLIDLADGVTYFYRGVGKYFVSLSLPNGMRYWNAMLINDAPKSRLNYVQFLTAFESWPAPVKALMNATSIDESILRPLYTLRPMTSWIKGRVALLGDAAHVMLPTLGQGANQALLDAKTLAQCIRAYLNEEEKNAAISETLDFSNSSAIPVKITEILQEYQSRRLSVANTALIESERHAKGLFSDIGLADTHDVQRRVHRKPSVLLPDSLKSADNSKNAEEENGANGFFK